jgi:glycosyltransferase involved in cell wall biosynthesis
MVTDEYPWPARTGYRQRLHWLVKILAAEGDLDLIVARRRAGPRPDPPPADIRLGRMSVVDAGDITASFGRRAQEWTLGSRPRLLVGQDWTAALALFRTWSSEPYDLVWFSHAPVYLALRDIGNASHVVDLDNLESSLLRHRRRVSSQRLKTTVTSLTASARVCVDVVDERRWRRLERQIATTAAATVVCSELDRTRLGKPNAWVVPNGYEKLAARGGRRAERRSSATPVFLFVGLLTYEPNRDAADFFARRVLPLIRVSFPGAQFRVVGRFGSEADVGNLRRLPGVTVTGELPDLTAELLAADVAVVPIRFGGGTRIKILEAFAHELPVVSTSVGCEGLDVQTGHQLLIADDPDAFASACLSLLRQHEDRTAMTARAAEVWNARYRWTQIAPAVTAILRAVSLR